MHFKTPWVDKVWLGIVGVCFVLTCVFWLVVWTQKLGWTTIGLYLAALFFIGFYRGLPSGDSRR